MSYTNLIILNDGYGYNDLIILNDGVSQFDKLWINFPQKYNVNYSSAGESNYILSNVVGTPIKVIEKAPSFGKYKQWVTTWKVPASIWNTSVPAGVLPKSKDTILIDGILWQVCMVVDRPDLMDLWRLECDYFEFTLELKDTINFLNATETTSATGERHINNTIIATMDGAIEPIEQHIREGFGALIDPERYNIWLDNDVSEANNPSIVKVGALIQDQNGTIYDVLEVNDREQLDKKTHCICEKKL